MSTRPHAPSFWRDLVLVLGTGRRRMPGLFVLMLVATLLDLLSVALIAPFLARVVGTTPSAGFASSLPEAIAGLGSVLLLVSALKAVAAVWVQERIARVTEGERTRLMVRLLHSFQARPYTFHLERNSTELVNTVVWYTQAFAGGVLANSLRLLADALVFVVIVGFLAFTDPKAVALLGVLLVVVFLGITRYVRRRLGTAIQRGAALNADVMHSVQQALGALREVRLLDREAYFRERLARAARGLVAAASAQSALVLVPRQAIETAMVTFLVLLVALAHTSGGATLLPLLGTFAVAAVRLMPAATALVSNWNNVRANQFAVHAIARELEATGDPDDVASVAEPAASGDVFESLAMTDIRFRYPTGARDAVAGIDLTIRAGEVIGIMGRSGAGKSTLADIVLGLVAPSHGTITVNGWDALAQRRRWQRLVAYIPQTVYLLDDTLRRNVALGVDDDDIDDERVRRAISSAQLDTLVGELPQGLDAVVGERGVRLSGGQRQRVAIARALYHQRQFLVLDEATSALDEETERDVVSAIAALAGSVTLFIIAHRDSTLAHASRVLVMRDGNLVERAR